ncbi:MAG: hypothetical protein AAF531_03775 [Actinomycetota bacterium]
MISQTRQRFAMAGMVAVALLAIVLAAIYQDDNKLDQPNIVGQGNTADAAAGDGAPAPAPTGPIEAFLPRSGEASACSEDIGVDLAPGFGARLTINGVEIAPEDMNVNLDEDGEISEVVTASRSLGQYTFKPDDNCPNGSLLRPVDNVLEVCVYRLSDNTQACAVRRENIFDAL